MDSFIGSFPFERDGDLMLCRAHGVAWQRDMDYRVDVPYYDKCSGYLGSEIAERINAYRVAFVDRFVDPEFPVLDIGVGSGEFCMRRPRTWGYDIDPKARAWLTDTCRWSDKFHMFRAFTFWDVLEHVQVPNLYFARMEPGSRLFTCLPIFEDISRIRESRHYRPGEHLYYFTADGFIAWMLLHRFELIGRATYECEAGRDSILTFAFQRGPTNQSMGTMGL